MAEQTDSLQLGPEAPPIEPDATAMPFWAKLVGIGTIAISLIMIAAYGLGMIAGIMLLINGPLASAAEWGLPFLFVGLCLSVFLMFCGSALLVRFKWSRKGFYAWSVLTLAFMAWTLIANDFSAFNLHVDPEAPAAVQSEIHKEQIARLAQTLFMIALPLFYMLWFSRKKIRDEVARWH